LLELRSDYNIKFENTCENKDILPEYFTNPNYSKDLFSSLNSDKIKKFLEENQEHPLYTDYHYYFTHPLKPVLFGPDKVDVHEHYKIHLVSPTCLIVEIYSYCSGFMLMDTFFTVIQYKYESELVSDPIGNGFHFKTKLNISYAIDFVKTNFFKGKVESEGLKDNEQAINEFVFPKIKSLLEIKSKIHYGEIVNGKTDELKTKLETIKNEHKSEYQERHKPIQENGFFQAIINKYSIILIFIFALLVFARWNFMNCFAIVCCIGFGILATKIDNLSQKIDNMNQNLK